MQLILAGGAGMLESTWQTGRYEGWFEAGPEQVRVTFTAGSSSGLWNMRDGMAEVRAANRIVSYGLTMPDGQGGIVEMDTLEIILDLPISPTEGYQDMQLRVAMIDVVGDEGFWSAVDADGHMTQDPARLVLEIAATGRLLRPLTEVPVAQGAPYEFANVSVEKAEVEMLGARAETTGQVEFVPPIYLPLGNLEVRVRRPGPGDRTTEQGRLVG